MKLILLFFCAFVFYLFPDETNGTNDLANESEIKSETKSSTPKKKGILLKADDPADMKRWAIVVGINDYNDIAVTDLSKAQNDAKVMGQILEEQGEFEKVFVMTDDLDAKDPLYPTRINIEEKLDSVLSFAGPDDLIVFFFSGHGISDSDGNAYILPVDTIMDKALYTSVSINNLIQKISHKKIKKSLLMLDACRDVLLTSKGSAKEGLQADKFSNAEVGATFFSTKSGYYSFEDPKSDFGVFTKYMAYGMEGKADTNGDGIVSFGELEEYVQNGVNDWSISNNKQQKPFVKYFKEKYGDLPITVKGVREKSLVEQNDYRKNDSKLPYVWRSALVPGWGQYYAGSKLRGSIYFFTSLLLFGNFYSSYTQLNSAQSAYSSAYAIPGSLFVPTYLNLQAKHSDLDAADSKVQSAYFLLVGAWLWNLFDAGVLTKQEKTLPTVSFDFRKEYIAGSNFTQGMIESRGIVKLSFEF